MRLNGAESQCSASAVCWETGAAVPRRRSIGNPVDPEPNIASVVEGPRHCDGEDVGRKDGGTEAPPYFQGHIAARAGGINPCECAIKSQVTSTARDRGHRLLGGLLIVDHEDNDVIRLGR